MPTRLTYSLSVALIVFGGALLFFAIRWLSPHPHVALDMPVSLSPGHITTGYFRVDPDTLYYIDVELREPTAHAQANCDPHSVLGTQWTLLRNGQVEERGSSPWEDSGLTLAAILGDSGSYAFDATIFQGAECLNARNPRLKVRTHVHVGDLYSALSWLSIWSFATGLVLLMCPWIGKITAEQRFLRIFPGMRVRNLLPFQRHAPMPPIAAIPNFGIYFGLIPFLLILFVSFSRRPMGLMTHVPSPNAAALPRAPESESLGVYVGKGGRFYVNGQLVPREQLRARLQDELSRRALWIVYFEADDDVAYPQVVYAIDTIRGLGAQAYWVTPRVREELKHDANP